MPLVNTPTNDALSKTLTNQPTITNATRSCARRQGSCSIPAWCMRSILIDGWIGRA